MGYAGKKSGEKRSGERKEGSKVSDINVQRMSTLPSGRLKKYESLDTRDFVPFAEYFDITIENIKKAWKSFITCRKVHAMFWHKTEVLHVQERIKSKVKSFIKSALLKMIAAQKMQQKLFLNQEPSLRLQTPSPPPPPPPNMQRLYRLLTCCGLVN